MISRRGIFGVLAGVVAVPFVKVEEAKGIEEPLPDSLTQVTLGSVRWFNKQRDFGMVSLVGVDEWHFRVSGDVLRTAGIDNPRPGQQLKIEWTEFRTNSLPKVNVDRVWKV